MMSSSVIARWRSSPSGLLKQACCNSQRPARDTASAFECQRNDGDLASGWHNRPVCGARPCRDSLSTPLLTLLQQARKGLMLY